MAGWSIRASLLLGAVAVAPGLVAGCSCGDSTSASGSAGTAAGGPGGGGQGGDLFTSGSSATSGNNNCPGGGTTTVSGTVYDPAGKVPLYNVAVYVPTTPLDAIAEGASCEQCSATLSGDPVVTALTDTHGRFVLEDVPAGQDIPLVIQVGKWRREFTLPSVAACVDNPTEDRSIRLPRNQSEGHIPKIALATGGADVLECLLRKIGIDDSEFTNEDGPGRVNLFAGAGSNDSPVTVRYADDLNQGAAFTPATSLWESLDSLMRYDIVLLSCEGGQYIGQKPDDARKAMFDYLSAGGRVFASHWHNVWLEEGPDPFPESALWNHVDPDPPEPFTGLIDTTFPKGEALADWLVNVEASTVLGEMDIKTPQHTVDDVNPEISTRWIYSESPHMPGVQYFTFNTPIGVPEEEQCGRLVYSDIHVSSGDEHGPPFPEGCTQPDLSPQEKALLFMLFDLSACISPDDDPPPIPE